MCCSSSAPHEVLRGRTGESCCGGKAAGVPRKDPFIPSLWEMGDRHWCHPSPFPHTVGGCLSLSSIPWQQCSICS